MDKIVGLYAYKKEGDLSNQIGVVEVSDNNDFAFQLRLATGTVVGFNSLQEIKIIELGN